MATFLRLRAAGLSCTFFCASLWASQQLIAAEFTSAFPEVERTWIGPEYWANRMHDWRVADGRLECVTPAPDRNVHLLTHQLGNNGDFEIRVRVGRLSSATPKGQSWAGLRVGVRGRFNDYRESAVYGKGIDAGLRGDGRLFIRAAESSAATRPDALADQAITDWPDEVELRLTCAGGTEGSSQLVLTAHDAGTELARVETAVENVNLHGNVALACHSARGSDNAPLRVWFADWRVSGERVEARADQTFGPILFAQHTLSRDVLKLTAQMPPIGRDEEQTVGLEIDRQGDGQWREIARAKIDPLARTARFRIPEWDASRDTPYRLVYKLAVKGGTKDVEFRGTIRRDPVDKPEIVVAAFTGNNDAGFPNTDVVAHVRAHQPDLLVFTGDQIYERVGGYGVQRDPLEAACLDYLRKWYIFGWSYRDLLRDVPAVCLPDDHDVFHGNLWGCGGRAAKGTGKPGQDSGGYTMPPEFVNMVERTQTSHMPDPYDPTPVEQGIGVYYCPMLYGGISFAVIEDRKFKSAPAELLPEGRVENGWFQNPDFDPVTQADAPGAQLLGDRQIKFLRDWAADYSGGAWMKVVLSQTIFADVVTLPPPANTDAIMPKLPILEPGEYPEGEVPVADADSNSWPQTPRNDALREIRKCFAFHIAGDQHLGSTIQYGIDEYRDAGFALCVPSVANVWPRRWFPAEPGANRWPGAPRYAGDYLDGFGNRMTVHAVCNPTKTGREPADLADRATGYGIARFARDSRKITVENWPRHADPRDASTGGPYAGWPITVEQLDNYSREPFGYLPEIEIRGATDPVVQVVNETEGEVVYTIRIRGNKFRPMVFAGSTYTVKVSDPDRELEVKRTGLRPQRADSSQAEKLEVELRAGVE